MSEKYPENYFIHFIEMFNQKCNEENLKNHANLASSIEGKFYLVGLKNELKIMSETNDWNLFIKIAKDKDVPDFELKHLEFLIEIIEESLK